MALTILVTPAAGDTIQSSAWINEFNNIYNNPISLISPLTATVNLNSQTLSNAATFSGAITFSSTVLFTTLDVGATDTTIARVSAGLISVEGVTLVDVSAAQTLTNKTITAPVLSGTVTGTYTLGGTPTISATAAFTNTSPFSVANGQTLTVATAAQTVGAAMLTIPNFAGVNDTFAFITLAQTLTNKTLTAPVFSGTVTGTYTLGGTPTLGAVTLGGTVSGGGNQINNVIIGAVTPLAGSFTTLAATGVLTIGVASAVDGTIRATTGSDMLLQANGTTVTQMQISGSGTAGVQVGAPTGGFKGVGTLNAVAVYDDNVLLTDWMFDLYFDGKAKPDDRFYKGQSLYSLKQVLSFAQEQRRLPWMPSRDDFENERSLGKMVTNLWFGQEQQQIYLFELEKRVKTLEAKP